MLCRFIGDALCNCNSFACTAFNKPAFAYCICQFVVIVIICDNNLNCFVCFFCIQYLCCSCKGVACSFKVVSLNLNCQCTFDVFLHYKVQVNPLVKSIHCNLLTNFSKAALYLVKHIQSAKVFFVAFIQGEFRAIGFVYSLFFFKLTICVDIKY